MKWRFRSHSVYLARKQYVVRFDSVRFGLANPRFGRQLVLFLNIGRRQKQIQSKYLRMSLFPYLFSWYVEDVLLYKAVLKFFSKFCILLHEIFGWQAFELVERPAKLAPVSFAKIIRCQEYTYGSLTWIVKYQRIIQLTNTRTLQSKHCNVTSLNLTTLPATIMPLVWANACQNRIAVILTLTSIWNEIAKNWGQYDSSLNCHIHNINTCLKDMCLFKLGVILTLFIIPTFDTFGGLYVMQPIITCRG